MSKEERILQQALELSPMERAVLIEQLLHSFDPEPSITAEIESAWTAEARERITAYRNGELTARSGEDVFADINRKYGA